MELPLNEMETEAGSGRAASGVRFWTCYPELPSDGHVAVSRGQRPV